MQNTDSGRATPRDKFVVPRSGKSPYRLILSPLTQCLDCQYPLEGLPSHHVCPECGFEYDDKTRAWTIGFPRDLFRVVIVSMIGLNVLMQELFDSYGDWIRRFLAAGVCVIPFVLGAKYLSRRPSFLAITPAGIVLRKAFRSRILIPWVDVQGLITRVNSFRFPTLRLKTTTTSYSLKCLFISPKEAESFAGHVFEAKKRYLEARE